MRCLWPCAWHEDFASAPESDAPVEVRIGVNLGPVRLVRDSNGQPNIIGDGINVAERVMSFAGTGQVLVSRSYYELLTRACEDYARLFTYQGSRTDKHVREHEIYEVAGPPTRRWIFPLAAARRGPSDVPVSPLCWRGLTQPAHPSGRLACEPWLWPTGQRRSP